MYSNIIEYINKEAFLNGAELNGYFNSFSAMAVLIFVVHCVA